MDDIVIIETVSDDSSQEEWVRWELSGQEKRMAGEDVEMEGAKEVVVPRSCRKEDAMKSIIDHLWCQDYKRVSHATVLLKDLVSEKCPGHRQNRNRAADCFGHAAVFWNSARFVHVCDGLFIAQCFKVMADVAESNEDARKCLGWHPDFEKEVLKCVRRHAENNAVFHNAVSLLGMVFRPWKAGVEGKNWSFPECAEDAN